MYHVEIYVRVRRACMVEGMSVREASRVFGLHRDTVRKMLAYSAPPGYRRQDPPRRPRLEPFTGVIDAILEADRQVPRKQRHTAKRIFERLRDEHGFDGQCTILKDYVRERRRRTQEMFVPLSHAQCDFGEARVIIGGVERKAHYLVLDLPHSDGCFVKAYPAETTEAFLDGRVSAPRQPHLAGMAGNSPVYSQGCKSPLPVAEGVAGNPSCRTFGRILYFRYSSQG